MPLHARGPQTAVVVTPTESGGLVPVTDIRLPQNQSRYSAPDLDESNLLEIHPIQGMPCVVASGNSAPPPPLPIEFNITGNPDVLFDWSNSWITFKVKLIKNTDGRINDYIAAADVAAASQVRVAAAGPAVLAVNDYVSFVYTRSVEQLFSKVEIKDLGNNLTYESCENYDLKSVIDLACQNPEFYDVDSGVDTAHHMGACVHTFTEEDATTEFINGAVST